MEKSPIVPTMKDIDRLDKRIDGLEKKIEEAFVKRILSAVTRLSNEHEALDKKKDLETEEGSAEGEILQRRIDRLDLLIEILQSLKQI